MNPSQGNIGKSSLGKALNAILPTSYDECERNERYTDSDVARVNKVRKNKTYLEEGGEQVIVEMLPLVSRVQTMWDMGKWGLNNCITFFKFFCLGYILRVMNKL